MKKYYGELGLILVSIVWGCGYVATQFGLDGGLTPLQIITMRFFLAALFINVIFFKHIKANIDKKALKSGIMLGIFLFVAFTLQTIGLMHTTPSKNAFITSANVVIVPFIGFLIYRRKLDKFGIISSFIALVGIGILSLESNLTLNFGDMLTLLCAFGFAFHIFFTSEFVKYSSPIVLTSIQFTVAFALSAVVQLGSGQWGFAAEPKGYMGVLFLAVFSTSICFFMQTICQKVVDGTKAAIILSTEAVFGTIFSVIVLHEALTTKLIIGSVLIFIAIIVAETKLSFIKKIGKTELLEEEEEVPIEVAK
ncbi:DMT family transporter [Clostridioides mangenotii]|uniref:DMT family transporter n=1 Tax=Metaclostridioides mangenotii TaxID=1540 RepID=UPI001C111F34|nr:DMT family transporter [Clostridioides mangenotii]MBU5306380.1 DMT family transporter [Clostridioides mangenotii]